MKTEKQLQILLICFLIGSIAFALFIAGISMKAKTGEYCSINTENKDYLNTLTTSNILLDSENSYFYKENTNSLTKQDTYIQKTLYCFNYVSNATTSLNVDIIDETQKVLSKSIIPTGNNSLCQEIPIKTTYTGLKCINCDSSNTLSINTISLSNNEETILNGNPLTTNELGITTKNYISCKQSVQTYMKYYLQFVTLLALIWLILLGLNGFEDLIKRLWK